MGQLAATNHQGCRPRPRLALIRAFGLKRCIAAAITAAFACAVLLAVETPTALANYYAIGENTGVTNTGASNSVCETKLWVYQPASDFVDQEMWLDFNNYWSEAGLTEGQKTSGYTSYPVFFWADDNTKYGYNQHFATYGPSAGSHYGDSIHYSSQPWWNVNIGGFTGSSWHDASTATGVQVGLEFTNSGSGYTAASGASQSVAYWDTSGTQRSLSNATQYVDGGAQGFWYKPYYYWSDILGGQPWSC